MVDAAVVDKPVDAKPAPDAPGILNQPPVVEPTPESKLFDKPADQAKPEPSKGDAAPATDKPAGEKPAATTEPPKPELKTPPPEAKPAPADYDLKLPEGSPLSKEELAQTLKDAKASGLDKEGAEKVLKMKDETARAVQTRTQATVLEQQKQGFEKARATWKDQTTKDPDIAGPQGEKLAENIELAKRAWDQMATPQLRALADQVGFSDHPEVVKLMVRIGRMMAEDTHIRGSSTVGPDGKQKAPEDILYGNPVPASEPMS